jgi:hypothetical protein
MEKQKKKLRKRDVWTEFWLVADSYFERIWLILLAAVLLLVFAAYYPCLNNYFASDDFMLLLFAKNHGVDLEKLFVAINDHLQPVFRFVLAIEYKLFGLDAYGYYLVGLLLHLTNTALAGFVFSSLLKNKYTGLFVALLFGISASHWRTTMWVTTQGQLLATTFFLISLLLFIKYLDTKKIRFLGASAAAHLLMMFSFTSGLELPVLFFLLYLALNWRAEKNRQLLKEGLIITTPFAAAVLIYLMARYYFVPPSLGFIETVGGVAGAVGRFPIELSFLFGGIYEGFLKSFAGVYYIHDAWVSTTIIVGFLALFILSDYSQNGLRSRWPILLCMLIWLLGMYFPSTLPRTEWGYSWFVKIARYRYLPCLPAAAIMAMLFMNLRPFSSKTALKFLIPALLLLPIRTTYSNFKWLRHSEAKIGIQTVMFKKATDKFIDQFGALLETGEPFVIVEIPIGGPVAQYAGWNVRIKTLAKLYFSPEAVEHVIFTPKKKKVRVNPNLPLFLPMFNGALKRVR